MKNKRIIFHQKRARTRNSPLVYMILLPSTLRARMAKNAVNLSHYKKLLFARFIEDWVYMTVGRDEVRNKMRQQGLKEFAETKFEHEYELEMKELFNSRAAEINRFLKSDFNVAEVYFPWHRSFEIGFTIKSGETSK